MGNGTEPRDDDVLALAESLQRCRQQVERLAAENKALREAWVRFSNFDRIDLMQAMEKLLKDFIARGSARLALNDAKNAAQSAPSPPRENRT